MDLSLLEVIYANGAVIDRIWALEAEGVKDEEYETLVKLSDRMVGYINGSPTDDFVNTVWVK